MSVVLPAIDLPVATMKCPIKAKAYLDQWGLTQEEYEVLWGTGHCPLCQKPYAQTPSRVAVVDHDHESGLVRGLLCSACNYAIGTRTWQWFLRVAQYFVTCPAARAGIFTYPKEYRDRD